MPPHSSQSLATPAPGQKSTLFCPNCGHDSPPDGDWHVRTETEHVVYDCPVCEDTITERPARVRQAPEATMSHEQTRGSVLARTVRIAFALTAWPCPSADAASQ
jgi:predicted RNA-binding Zn-ribbon protein involved in translation (DUF1610 family)